MKKTLHSILFTSSLMLTAALPTWAGDDHHHADTPSFKTQKITNNINLLQGKGGNIAVLSGSQGLLMVDADYKVMSAALKTEINKLGGLDKLTYLINTHWHGDHTEGNLALGEYATIIAHDNVRQRLLTAQEVKLFKMKSEPYPKIALPSITYSSSMNLYINQEHLQLLHFSNGHTDGDTVVFFKDANVVHTGDHYFNGFFPFVDTNTGGSAVNMAKNVKSIIAMIDDQTQVIPGHGALSNKKELIAFQAMLEGTAAEVKAMKDKGMSLAEIQKQGLSSQWDTWTHGFLNTDTWISIIFASL